MVTKAKNLEKKAATTKMVKAEVPAKPNVVVKKTLKTSASALKSAVNKKDQAKISISVPKEVTPKKEVAPAAIAHTKTTAENFGIQPYALEQSEEYMNPAQQAHFKQLLHAWRVNLAAKIDAAVSNLKDEPKHFADLNDRATQEEEFNLELKARDREADLMVTIDEALKRLNEGEYGYCQDCGIEIGIRRLEARPTATECIDCKTLLEMRERQTGGVF